MSVTNTVRERMVAHKCAILHEEAEMCFNKPASTCQSSEI